MTERRRDLSAVVALATLSLSMSVLINAGVVCSNDGSQYALTRSLADGTAIIDAHWEYTDGVDYAQIGDHKYSDRPPHVAFLAVPVYLAASGLGLDDAACQAAVTGLAHVAGAIAVVLLFLLARRLGASRVGAVGAALALAWCTPLRSYSATLFSHAFSAALILALVWIALPPESRVDPKRRRRWLLLGGVLGGYACGVDYTNGLPVVLLCLGGAWLESEGDWRRALPVGGLYLGGGLIGAAPTLVYHTVVFGAPWSLSYFHDARFEYAHSAGSMYSGPFLEGFFGLLVSPHAGLLLWSPVLVFALAFWPALRSTGKRFWVLLLPWVALYLVTSKNLTWHAGATQDVRYLVSVLPLIALPLAWAFDWAFGVRGKLRPVWLSVLGFLFFASAIIQIAKHNALWARDGSQWIERLAATMETDAGPTLAAFASWAYPHPIAAAVVLVIGLAISIGLRGDLGFAKGRLSRPAAADGESPR